MKQACSGLQALFCPPLPWFIIACQLLEGAISHPGYAAMSVLSGIARYKEQAPNPLLHHWGSASRPPAPWGFPEGLVTTFTVSCPPCSILVCPGSWWTMWYREQLLSTDLKTFTGIHQNVFKIKGGYNCILFPCSLYLVSCKVFCSYYIPSGFQQLARPHVLRWLPWEQRSALSDLPSRVPAQQRQYMPGTHLPLEHWFCPTKSQ